MAPEVTHKATPSDAGASPVSDTVSQQTISPSNHPALHQACKSVDRLIAIEQDLVRRIVGQYELDRQVQHLLIELQICSTRMREQLIECTAASVHERNGRYPVSEKK